MRHLYLHVPFCSRRCTYCDFAIAVRKHVPVDEFIGGVDRELSLRLDDRDRLTLDTLYLGGGTPSRLGADGVARLLDVLRSHVELAAGAEVTLEANPEDVVLESVRAWRTAGVNRLSIGGQSFDDAVLRWMHRTHDAAAIERAVDQARAGGIENHSLDLIFALPETLGRDWECDLTRAVALEPTHVSLYGLTVEPRTPLGRRSERGEVLEAPEERYEREFLQAHETFAAAGFDHYEVSNFAKPGWRSGHNSAYWKHVPYAGVGPSAHEFDGRSRRWNVEAYTEWLRRVEAGLDPISGSEVLSADDRRAEDVYLGLRTDCGLALSASEHGHVRPWVDAGWATHREDRLVLTPLGWLRLDSLAAD
jgi:oxygen-independent coproporphyrinogen-3 oxidase